MKAIYYMALFLGCLASVNPAMSQSTCARPIGLVTANIKDVSAVLQWSAVAGATSYQIRYSLQSNTAWTLLTVTNSIQTSKLVNNLSPLSAYKWQIRAKCGTQWSTFSGLNLFSTKGKYYRDIDSDGYGNTAIIKIAYPPQIGYSLLPNDCSDTNAEINPAAAESCNLLDDDCDGLTDAADPSNIDELTWYLDADGDAFGDPNTSLITCFAAANYTTVGGDCNDENPTIYPFRKDYFDAADNDCDGSFNEDDNSATFQKFRPDEDGDGFGSSTCSKTANFEPLGYLIDSSDCNDSNLHINTAAPEICNDIDDNCDGITDIFDICPTPPAITLQENLPTYANVSWPEQGCIYRYVVEWTNDDINWFPQSLTGTETALDGLTPATLYKARMRYQCSESLTDFGPYSPVLVFTTPSAFVGKPTSNTLTNSILVYPNPAKNQVNITVPNIPNGVAQLVVIDAFGRLLHSHQIQIEDKSLQFTLDISTLPVGIYSAILRHSDGTAATTFVVN